MPLHRIRSTVCLIALLLLTAPARGLAAPGKVTFSAVTQPEIEAQDFFEVQVQPAELPAGNPFVDADVTATLTGPDGRSVSVDGFCDSPDGSVYRVRFLAMVPGTGRLEDRPRHPN